MPQPWQFGKPTQHQHIGSERHLRKVNVSEGKYYSENYQQRP